MKNKNSLETNAERELSAWREQLEVIGKSTKLGCIGLIGYSAYMMAYPLVDVLQKYGPNLYIVSDIMQQPDENKIPLIIMAEVIHTALGLFGFGFYKFGKGLSVLADKPKKEYKNK